MVKRFLTLGLLLLIPYCPAPVVAETDVVGPFSTLNNTDTSLAIPSDKAQDLLNVDITPGGKSVLKRKGYGTAFTLSKTTSAVHGVYNFYDSNGADVSLFFNDYSLSVSVSGGSPSIFFSTGSNAATYQCVDSAGFAYCANTGRTSLLKISASTATSITSVASTGTMVAVTPERLVLSGFSEAQNRVDFSKANDFSTWTPGGQNTDPINFTIVSPGSRITHITYAHGRVYWFKESSFGYILPGPTQGDWVVRTVNSFVGTLYNTSIFRDDILYFQGQDGHFYAWDGSNLVKLSRDIQDTIDVTQGRISGSWTQTTSSDFGTGFSSGTTTFIDTTTVSNQLSLSLTPAFVGKQSDQTFVNFNMFGSSYYYSKQFSPTVSTQTMILSYVQLSLHKNISSGNFTVNLLSDSSDTPGSVIVSSVNAAARITASGNYNFSFNSQVLISSGTKYWIQLISPSFPASEVLWNECGTTQDGFATAQGSTVYVATSSVINHPIYSVYVTTYPTTGTWQSAVKNAPNLSSWDSFSATTLNSNGTHSFFIRSSAGSFTANSSTPSWTAISIGAVPTISTGANFQIRDVLTTSVSTTTPILYDFTQNWFEGSATDKTYGVYHDSALWWSITSGTGSTTNNRIAKYDLLNQGWLLYDIPMNGMYVRNQRLYFGSPTAGYIYKFGDTTNDNGSAINAYWKSKDLVGSNPFVDKDYNRLSLSLLSVANSSMTVTYTVNGSSSTNVTVPLASSASFIKKNRNLPQGTSGNTFNIQFGNNAIDQPFEVFGIGIDYTSKPWIPQ